MRHKDLSTRRNGICTLTLALLALGASLHGAEAQPTGLSPDTFDERFFFRVDPPATPPPSRAAPAPEPETPPRPLREKDVEPEPAAAVAPRPEPAKEPERRPEAATAVKPTPENPPKPDLPSTAAETPKREKTAAEAPKGEKAVSRPAMPARSASARASNPERARHLGSGRAAWYQHPGRTASGERYNPDGLTAAHGSLPFGTRVRVVNKENGRAVVVRVNDRVSRLSRKLRNVIELSRAGARRIGIAGIGTVALYRVE